MFKKYIIGALAAISIVGAPILWFMAKRAGKKQEQFDAMEKYIDESLDAIKKRNARASDSIDGVRKRLCEDARD